MGNQVTIKDVAKAAGVSVSTVSYTISGKRSISAEVRKNIFSKIRELDYRPNLLAASLRNRTTHRIGIVSDGFTNPGSSAVLQALSDSLRAASYEVIYTTTGLDVERGREELHSLSRGLVDGVLNLLPQIDPGEASLLCGTVPVYTSMRDPYAPFNMDFGQATRQAAEHFIAKGHRRIGYLSSKSRFYRGEDASRKVFAETLARHGISFSPKQIVLAEDTVEGGRDGMEKLFSDMPVTAVLTGNDLMALGVYRWAAEHALKVPDDISVIGFDNILPAALAMPGLSTFDWPVTEAADYAAKMLLEKINGKTEPHPEKFFPVRFIERQSVAERSGR